MWFIICCMKNTETDKTGRQLNQFSTEEWIELVAKYRKSGLTLKRFSEANNLNPNTFKYWIYDVNNLNKKAWRRNRIQKQNFVEITSPLKINSMGIEVIMPNGVRVSLSSVSKEDIFFIIKEVATCLD
ncbi:MAG: hypothetical protein PF692_06595 [Kiritimatiellae bacterium]|nr:hypothetical protein [Kiritimatiellia bacterium]